VLEFLGLQVSRLIRVSYGPIMLDDLPPRGVDEVPPQLVAELMNMLKRNEREDRINRGERAQRDGRTERPR
jgi:23S rRNA pseudouridine2605 synthase